jgi:hypothetical protein
MPAFTAMFGGALLAQETTRDPQSGGRQLAVHKDKRVNENGPKGVKRKRDSQSGGKFPMGKSQK